MSLKIYTASFRRQADYLMWIGNWKNARQFWARQARGVIREVIAHIPPANGKADLAAKRRGEQAVEADIRKVFVGVAPSRAKTIDMHAAHQRERNGRGQVQRSLGDRRYPVTRAALRDYIQQTKPEVGKLAGGFNPAAAKTGYRPPAWIWRHQSPGSVTLTVTERGIRFRATNAVRYASDVANLERQIQKGINRQTQKIWRESNYFLLNAAIEVGFDTKA